MLYEAVDVVYADDMFLYVKKRQCYKSSLRAFKIIKMLGCVVTAAI